LKEKGKKEKNTKKEGRMSSERLMEYQCIKTDQTIWHEFKKNVSNFNLL